MAEPTFENSVGLVQTQVALIPLPPEGFALECGAHLPALQVAYETYGVLSPARDNVVFICHALSGDAHVAGYHSASAETAGWWEEMVGPGKGIDTQHYFVVCANILGGCKGTTGPSSLNPATGRPYGAAFPPMTVGDIVAAHRLLLQQLGIARVAAVVGGSFGGMQALLWALRYPATVARCICIASAARMSAQALAFDIVARKAVTEDPDWQRGDYYGTARAPVRGLTLARQIGHITYLSPEMMTRKFGRERKAAEDDAGRFDSTFQVESYLDHQGEKFIRRFDANSYLHITQAMDEFDLVERHGSLERAFAPLQAKTLVVALGSDWLFPPEQSLEIAHALLQAGKPVSYCELRAPHGHDAFLVDIEHLAEVLRAFLPWVGKAKARRAVTPAAAPRAATGCGVAGQHEYHIIRDMIRPNSRVLDLGCGNGNLLTMLAEERGVAGVGVEIDIAPVIEVIDKGHDILQGDIDAGLASIPDGAYDYAILSETLQVVRKPRFVLREMLRVAREGIVSFPNFGKWSHRLALLGLGRMPKGGALPYEWYDTPNIHLFTLRDFVELCRQDGISVRDVACIPDRRLSALLVKLRLCNLGADRVLIRIAAKPEGAGRAEGHFHCRECGAVARCKPWLSPAR